MLLFRQWPRAPKMDARAYRQYRLRLLALLLLWLAVAVAVVFYWQQLPLLAKAMSIAMAAVITPDVGMIEQLFSSYERYSQRGLE